MNKLLYLVHRIPYPPNKGDKIRSFNFLRALAADYEVYLGCFIDDPDDKHYIEALKPYCQECLCLEIQPKVQKIKSLSALATGKAMSLPYYYSRELQTWVDSLIAEQGIERALIFSSPMAQYLEKHAGLKRIADFVDIDSDKWQQYAAKKNWPAKWIYQRESGTLLEFERKIAALFDTTLFVSAQEAALFKTLAPAAAEKISFVENGVDTVFFDPGLTFQSPFRADELAIVFTGAMDYWANVDAVIWFAQQVFPIIRQQVPQARFYIVGSKPIKAVQLLAENDPAVIVTGRVEDIRDYLAFAHFVVAPLRIARGIQNKVLEALAFAKVVLATSMAMEGIQGEAGLNVTVTDTPEQFAAESLSLLAQPQIQAMNNREYVQSSFSWHKSGLQLQRLLADGEPDQ